MRTHLGFYLCYIPIALIFTHTAPCYAFLNLPAQNTFNISYGGNGDECGNCVAVTSDNGFIIIGSTTSFGANNNDIWIVKTDSQGAQEWSKQIDVSRYDDGISIMQVKDGGYIALVQDGRVSSSIIRINSSGIVEWSKPIPKLSSPGDFCLAIDGGYVLTGGGHSPDFDIVLVHIDESGNTTWTKEYSSIGNSGKGRAIIPSSDGGYIVSGRINLDIPGGNHEAIILKTNSFGELIWHRYFGSSGHYRRNPDKMFPFWDFASDIAPTKGGGYIIVGGAVDNRTDLSTSAILIIGIDRDANELFRKHLKRGLWATGRSIVRTKKGFHVVTGLVTGESQDEELCLIAIESSGKVLWERAYGGSGSEGGNCIIELPSGKAYVTVGETTSFGAGPSALWLLKTDSNGMLRH